MSTFLKVALGLLLTLPLGAYITGTLVASQADMPQDRAPVVVDSPPSETPPTTPAPPPSPTRSPGDDRGDDHDDDHDDDDDVRVIRPTPREVDDDRAEDLADDREDRADDLADEREDRADDLADEREDRADDSSDGADGD